MQMPIYLDNHATTPVDPRVLERMLPFFTEIFGNAASRSHAFGWKAEEAVEVARGQVARLIDATAREIVFVSGATEGNNTVLFGVAEGYASKGRHIVTQVTEHKSVLDACRVLAKRGCEVTFLPVNGYGQVSCEAVRSAIRPDTILVSVMLGNNEVGTLQPIAEIGAICREAKVVFHTDAAQGAARLPLDVEASCIDVASLSAHKMYGPKGVGALYVRRRNPRVHIVPMIHGGGHERGLRSGTLNVPAIVGFGEACRIAAEQMHTDRQRIAGLRDRLHEQITSQIDGVKLNGHPDERLPGNLNLSFARVEGEALLLALKDLAVSSGSACTSATLEPSYVLRAMGVADDLARSSIRFGIGRFNTEEEIDHAAAVVVDQVRRLRRMASG